MLIYWIFFSTFAVSSLFNVNLNTRTKLIILSFVNLTLIVFIGLRNRVGGDWFTYFNDFNKLYLENSGNQIRDFGYEYLSRTSEFLNLGIFGVNFFAAVVFIYAIYNFGKRENNIALIYLISFPYFITVLAMGYTRQSTALAFALLSLFSIVDKKILKFIIFSLLAISFHKSASIFIMIVAVSFFNWNIRNLIIISFISAFSFFLIEDEIARITAYLDKDLLYQSPGVLLRIFINLIPCGFFIIFHKKLSLNKNEKFFLSILVLMTFMCLLIYKDYSTLADRLLIYFNVIQLFIMVRLTRITENYKIFIKFFVIFIYFITFYIWMGFANHVKYWIPYNNILFTSFVFDREGQLGIQTLESLAPVLDYNQTESDKYWPFQETEKDLEIRLQKEAEAEAEAEE